MSEHRMGAIFYIPLDERSTAPSLGELAARVKLRITHREQDRGKEVLYGQWGIMQSVRVEHQVLDWHVCLQMFPHLSDLLDRVGGERDESTLIAEIFRDACEALQPDAAMLYTQPDAIEPEYINAQYPKVLGEDGILLDDSSPVLLYLNAQIAAHYPTAYQAGRDTLPVTSGLLLFRGSGAHRWW